jgi:hypothetical protein
MNRSWHMHFICVVGFTYETSYSHNISTLQSEHYLLHGARPVETPLLVMCEPLCFESIHHQIACFKVTAKSSNVSTRTADPRRVKTA